MARCTVPVNSDNESDGLSDLKINPIEDTSQQPIPASARSSQKWSHDQISGGTQAVNGNLVTVARNLAKRRKLTDDQIADVESFLNKNITHYVNAVSISTHLRSFLGPATVVNKLLDLNLDLPDNIRQNQAALNLLTEEVAETFTQCRSTMKKIKASLGQTVNKKYTPYATDPTCDNIFSLTQVLVKHTKCAVSAELCAQVAILRHAYKKTPGIKYWEKVDKMMKSLREKGDHDPKKISSSVLEAQVLANGDDVDAIGGDVDEPAEGD
ncbi:hypothetical protein K435DRAFT_875808 [Dendrothele bispora CBS 962.96]|uniref:Uncharacterized protein n=1 Tax=Dendrothele bispora (strain CBS 962.96) TaxID=1314807 RepID=A0A4S8KTU3_DENBC|nr:hypothetical protein K435DRAFT_875808 [Dendrothele bispora CBS 962.96]